MKKILWISAVLVITFAVNSCEKQVVKTNQEIQDNFESSTLSASVKSDMLYFENVDSYIESINTLASMSEEEKDNWEMEIGFKSLRTIQNEFLDELETIEDEEQEKEFVAQNSKYLAYKEIEGEIYLEFTNNNLISNTINNADNMYIIGDSVYKRIDNNLVYAKYNSENVDALKEMNIVEDNSNFKISAINGNVKTTTEYSNSVNNSANNRKVTYKIGYEDIYQDGTYYTLVYYGVTGYKYYWGSWHKYRSTLTHNGTSGKMNFVYYDPNYYGGNYVNRNLYFSFSSGSTKTREFGDWKCPKADNISFTHGGFINTYGSATGEDVNGNASLSF